MCDNLLLYVFQNSSWRNKTHRRQFYIILVVWTQESCFFASHLQKDLIYNRYIELNYQRISVRYFYESSCFGVAPWSPCVRTPPASPRTNIFPPDTLASDLPSAAPRTSPSYTCEFAPGRRELDPDPETLTRSQRTRFTTMHRWGSTDSLSSATMRLIFVLLTSISRQLSLH